IGTGGSKSESANSGKGAAQYHGGKGRPPTPRALRRRAVRRAVARGDVVQRGPPLATRPPGRGHSRGLVENEHAGRKRRRGPRLGGRRGRGKQEGRGEEGRRQGAVRLGADRARCRRSRVVGSKPRRGG